MTKSKSSTKKLNGANMANGAKHDKKPKVSENDIDSTVTTGLVEQWDLLYKIPQGDAVPCRLDGCKQNAVECWASNLHPDDKWNMCTECTEKEFGPPEQNPQDNNPSKQVTKIKDEESLKENDDAMGQDTGDSNEKEDGTVTKVRNKPLPIGPTSGSDIPATETPSSTTSITPPGANGNVVEKWDILYKIPLEDSIPCRLDGCKRSAVECWISNLYSDDKWNMCAECTEKEFGPPQDDTNAEDATNQAANIENSKPCDPTKMEVVHVKEKEVPKEASYNAVIKEKTKAFCTSIASVTDTDEPTKSASDNESSTAQTTSENTLAESEEKWDIIRKIPEEEKIFCRIDGCNKRAVECWVSNLEPNDEWNLCPECVEAEFGIEEPSDIPGTSNNDLLCNDQKHSSKVAELSLAIQSGDCRVTKEESNSAGDPTTKTARPVSPSNNLAIVETVPVDSADSQTNDGVEEGWDMKKVMSAADLSKEITIKCSTVDCVLSGAVVYLSTKTKQKWYCCLDCQETEFGGWPEKLAEIPIDSMAESHKRLMVQKCSSQASPTFPSFFGSPIKSRNKSVTLTPPPNEIKQVTPTPGAKKAKPSAQAMAIHRKWQAAAETMGGPDARIVVEKKAAKKLIFDLLYDAFRPMNITQIHAALKAVVPSPVLKQCLDDMSIDKEEGGLFDDSDDEDKRGKNKKGLSSKSGDSFTEVLAFKVGRSSNTSLYYIDHTKQKNNGNGLESEERNDLHSKKALAEQDAAQLKKDLVKMEADTKQLNSEPTNEDAITKLERDEAAIIDLREKLDDARKLKVNEKIKKQTKRRIENMVSQWRKRRRLCMDFLISMEENTDGVVTVKKCLSGDGQIDIESDLKAITDAKTYAANKKFRKIKPKLKARKPIKKGMGMTNSCGIPADEKFIGVELSTQGTVRRVHLDEDE